MLLNLNPYITWLGIMLTSKPNDLQNRLNILSQPSTTISPSSSPSPPSKTPASNMTITTTSKPKPTTNPDISDYFICSGMPVRRYAHPRDCTKYYNCTGETDIVLPTVCPSDLYFSATALVCTLPEDSGCTITWNVTESPLPETGSEIEIPDTTLPIGATWLRRIEASNYYKPVNEDRLVIYYDHDVNNPQNILWPIHFTRDMWESIVMMYGNFGPQNRLYVVLRGGSAPSDELHYSSYLDSSRNYVNAVEVSSTDWSVDNSTNADLIAKNLAQIVSRNARGIRYHGIEPNWSDIFVYDLYQRTRRTADRDRWESDRRAETEGNIASIPLFTQWYLPIYLMYGQGSVLNRFFILREQYFPKAIGDNSTFARIMNRGEFVHFWSGSTGANLTGLASSVFGWSDSLNEMYHAARIDFSALNY